MREFRAPVRQIDPRRPASPFGYRLNSKDIVAFSVAENVDPVLAEKLFNSMSHAVEPSFPSRMAELCARISAPLRLRMGIDLEEFVSDVVVTRNFYTHTGRTPRAAGGGFPWAV
ncbi:MAG: HEPN domain-containing protein [Candidatus Acidiferrum sp.]